MIYTGKCYFSTCIFFLNFPTIFSMKIHLPKFSLASKAMNLSVEWMGTVGMWSLIFRGTSTNTPFRITSAICRKIKHYKDLQ